MERACRLVRPLADTDLEAVWEIERESFPNQRPTPQREFFSPVSRYLAASELHLEGVWGLQGQKVPTPVREKVVGYIGMWLMGPEAHIVALAVALPWRRKGFGQLLLMTALQMAASLGKEEAVLECRVSNLPALSLYEKLGFRKAGVRARYYSDNQEDAYIMVRDSLGTRQFWESMRKWEDEYLNRWGPWQAYVNLGARGYGSAQDSYR